MSRLCGYNTKDAKQSVDKYTSKEYFCALKGLAAVRMSQKSMR